MRIATASLLIVCSLTWGVAGCGSSNSLEEVTVEWTEYEDPPQPLTLTDDVVDPAKIPDFNPDLAHSVPVKGWEINLSHTIFYLDVPVLKPDSDGHLLKLRPNYRQAIEAAKQGQLLPSVNLIDGKAKQFDDGLYAALDLAYYSAHEETLVGHVQLVKQLAAAVGPESPAAPFLSAGLSLAGIDTPVSDTARRDEMLRVFESNKLRSKPLGFYDWSAELQECYRFLKFMQQPFDIEEDKWPAEMQALAQVLESDETLRADYQQAIEFYSRLTNPPVALSLLDVQGETGAAAAAKRQVSQQMRPAVAVFPASTNREQRLFDRLFPLGFPAGANLMEALILAVQKGDVDLAPTADSGWYDYQCFALETFLLPQRGEETSKLILTAQYKQRMVDAFAALITKHRETHIRSVEEAGNSTSAEPFEPLEQLSPTLRLEPNATYYLRTARAYAFLQAFLHEALGEEYLAQIQGLREGGRRETDLATELANQVKLFYGFYLLSVEDIGLPPVLKEGELTDPESARRVALDWLTNFREDPDLGVDTRVVVPVAVNTLTGRTQLWGTAGVRLAELTVRFDYGYLPSVRPAGTTDEWKTFDGYTASTTYLIPVDEFVSFEIDSLNCPTREEFRRMCDDAETTDELQAALQGFGN